jgi:hypothetical protein
MLQEITRSLQDIDISGNRAQSIRQMLLVYTARIMDAMHDNLLEESSSPDKPAS